MTILAWASMASLFAATVAIGQTRPLRTALDIAQDAADRVQVDRQKRATARDSLPVSADEYSSKGVLAALDRLLRDSSSPAPAKVFKQLASERDDIVRRCATFGSRDLPVCKTISPRVVFSLENVTRPTEHTLVIEVRVTRWERARESGPPGYTTQLQYRRNPSGEWQFDRILATLVS